MSYLYLYHLKSDVALECSTDDDFSNENLNLADLDLNKLKLSEEDALALSYLTPGLSRRIQKQLLAQLAPSEVRKLQRTLSSRTSDEHQKEPKKMMISRQLSERSTSSTTLPRRLSSEMNRFNGDNMLESVNETNIRTPRSFLPIKRDEVMSKPSYEFNVRSSSIGAEPKGDSKFLTYRNKPKITKSLSVREPRSYSVSRNDLQSPDSSISESSSKCISDSSASRAYSKYSDSSSFSRYSPSRYDSNQLLAASSTDAKSDGKKSTTGKKVSRFLRPDFFDVPKEESTYLKEKKEREMETQKVLKEIRDKRKSRLRRERSQSREKQLEHDESERDFYKKKEEIVKEADKLLTNVCNSIKTLENNMKGLQQHDYVNVPGPSKAEASDTTTNTVEKSAKLLHDYVNVTAPDVTPIKKEKVSRIARPKSYPSEKVEETAKKISPDKESKLTKLRKGFSRQGREKTKEDKNLENKTINQDDKGQKNKLLQSIEKKLEKFRSTGNMVKDPKEIKAMQEKKSSVENAIKRLREQSLPRNLEHCTESGLIKRAVSVEDMSGSTPLQASRKSVTKILGLFKKYEEQDKKKVLKKTKSKENDAKIGKKESDTNDKQKESVMKEETTTKKTETKAPNNDEDINREHREQNEKKERPRSLLFDKVRQFQTTPTYNGAKSDSVLVDTKETKANNANNNNNKSKLPVNSYRRSLNLDNLPEPPKFYKNPSVAIKTNTDEKSERKNLKLDLSKTIKPTTTSTTDASGETSSNRNSTATDDSSTILSPSDDYLSCDSWSVCSDFHHINDLQSPLSPNGGGGHIIAAYSGDENESVIDRIRRKSFYTRFNEKKRTPRRTATISYKDLDFGYNKSPSSTTTSSSSDNYHQHRSLDRRSFVADQRNNNNSNPVTRRSSYASSLLQESSPSTSHNNGFGNNNINNRPYVRSASVMNDYVNVPNRYQTYSSKIGRPNSTSIYSDPEDNNSLDDLLSTAKSRKYSTQLTTSRTNNRTSVSPTKNDYLERFTSTATTPTSSEPI